jgi:hypothetical protein
MNRNLLSLLVLVVFAFLAVFPASTRSITDRVLVVTKAKMTPAALSKVALNVPKRVKL